MSQSARVTALYRYPVKGFTRESCAALDVLPGGRIAGDRVFALRFNDSATPDDAWSTKVECVALVHTPGIARLRLRFDHATLRLRVERDDVVVFDGALDGPGRTRFADVVGEYVRALDESPIGDRTDRLPLRLVGDGTTPRHQDREPGYVTLHGRGSLAAVAEYVGETPELAEQRFRSNIAVAGLDAWEEQRFVGRRLRIGDVEFHVANPVTRCLATHANPVNGTRDIPMMKKLLEMLPTERPTFAVMMTSERGGAIRVGDELTLLE
jgi:uncharacterized protein YcbX